ncbi:MAG: hypothetical protein A7316_05800 [Candidatus Altiarchaeales archaeon WOR_SM1_86-2]|nr:MAG: hypothetical protein A7315_05610 [Candidatus Altiarchaeales archaeon WOR_SM1_79]ODS39351.1 MAG: hypothetical protein A7316_05800 [Candidatus Altiarchaeales archaeon WOR_SM1_86-2]
MMIVLLDTTELVGIDRGNPNVIDMCKRLTKANAKLLLSIITVSEIFTGTYLKKDSKDAVAKARRLLAQFEWIDMNAKIAEKTGELMAHLISKGEVIEYQDVVITATFLVAGGDYLITENIDHFSRFPQIKAKVYNAERFLDLNVC